MKSRDEPNVLWVSATGLGRWAVSSRRKEKLSFQPMSTPALVAVAMAVVHRPDETSPVPSPWVTTSRSPYAGGSFAAASRFFTASMAFTSAGKLGSLWFLLLGLAFRRCRANGFAIHFMLRAAVLLSFLRRILRFSATGHPEALGAWYVASWQLPRLDFNRIAAITISRSNYSDRSTWVPRLSGFGIAHPKG